jgi:uncharacterized protein YecE (DUF72 family)
MEIRIGISGWRYTPWRGTFYPRDLVQKKELWFASRQVNSIEINGSFYATQSPKSYKAWYEATPDDFVFSVKGPQYITHIRRLADVELPLANFFGSGVLHLKEKLGPFLWQLPPSFRFDEELIEKFLALLPQDWNAATRLAKKADRLEPDFPTGIANHPLHHAMEIRHHSFENPDFVALLRKYNIALVLADTAGKWPYMEDVTSDFMYLRLHGDEEIYKSGYDNATLHWWEDRIREWSHGGSPQPTLTVSEDHPSRRRERDIFVYFDNDMKVKAPEDAKTLAGFLVDL